MHNTKVRTAIADFFRAGAITSLWGASLLWAGAIGFYGMEIITAEVNLNVTGAYNWQGLKNSCIGGSLLAVSSFLGNTLIGVAIDQNEDE